MTFDSKWVKAVCEDTYIEEVDKDGGYIEIGDLDVKERMIQKYMAWRKCDRKTGEKYFAGCTMFYENIVRYIADILNDRGELKPEKKLRDDKFNFDSDYVYELSCDLGNKLIGKKKFVKQHMEKNKSTRERAEKRFQDYSQNYAPIVRSVLRALARRSQLPKHAYRVEKK